MSVSKWAYVAEKCDGDYCCGDCDSCPKADDNMPVINQERLCNQCEQYVEASKHYGEDCISREEVDKYIVNLLSGYLYDEERTRLENLIAFIWELPSVQPQPKIEVSEDCISREALKESVMSVPIAPLQSFDKVVYRNVVFEETIDKLPSVQPQPKIEVSEDCISRQLSGYRS